MARFWRKKLLLIGLTGMLAAGCASQGKTTQKTSVDEAAQVTTKETAASSEQSNSPTVETTQAIPADSPLAKVKIGMSEGRLYDLLGQPTEAKNYLTGKSWIPFYFGPDTHRKEVLYKGLGRITLKPNGALGTGVYKVFKVTYDPSEDGYAD